VAKTPLLQGGKLSVSQ